MELLHSNKEEEGDVFFKLLKDRTIFLYEDIDKEVSARIVASLLYLDSQNKKEIKLIINSSGGESESFFAIYDAMNYVASPIKTICIGEASSSAAELLAGGTPGRRLATPNAQIMIHGIQMPEISGAKEDVEGYIDRYNYLHDVTLKIFSENTGQSISKISKDIVKDKYLNAEEALDYGIIDKILYPKKKR